jgi:hypothetical protein
MQTLDTTSSFRLGVRVVSSTCHLYTVMMDDTTFDTTERAIRRNSGQP